MALIFSRVFIVFTVSSSEFQQPECLDFIVNDEWPKFTQPQSTGLSVWGNAGVLTKAVTEAKTSSRVLKCTFVNLVCVTGASH